jgi:hypothetical protein
MKKAPAERGEREGKFIIISTAKTREKVSLLKKLILPVLLLLFLQSFQINKQTVGWEEEID